MFKVIQELFESQVLDNFYEARSKKLLSVILKENNFDNSNVEDDLLNTIELLVQNHDEKKQLLHKAKDFEESMNQETSILTQNFYKVGFADGILFARDIKEIVNWLKNKK